jgi:uncharacterized protein YecE (DUF72 family)
VLWQLPENFHRDLERLAAALQALPRGRHALEFRHPSWFTPEVYALLRERDAALVIGDHPERRFQSFERTASCAAYFTAPLGLLHEVTGDATYLAAAEAQLEAVLARRSARIYVTEVPLS